MVSTIRFRSFKTFDLQSRKPYTALVVIAVMIAAIATHPRAVLVVMAYGYLASAFIGQAISRFRHRGDRGGSDTDADAASPDRRVI
jgi:phosphatidylserine synthase